MANIKSYTDLPQSMKLAEFLSPESADMYYMEAIIDTLNRVDQRIIETNYGIKHKDAIDWIRTLKDRVGCEADCTTMWKPSDEQLHYLSWIANIKLGDSVVEQEVSKQLNELYEDLKKLKELKAQKGG